MAVKPPKFGATKVAVEKANAKAGKDSKRKPAAEEPEEDETEEEEQEEETEEETEADADLGDAVAAVAALMPANTSITIVSSN